MGFWMINCKQYAELVSARMDRHVTTGNRLAIKLHEWLCPPCQRVAKQFTFLREACRYVPPEAESQVEDVLPEEARERMRCALRRCMQGKSE